MTIDRFKLDAETDPKKLLAMLKDWDESENERYKPLYHEWERNFLFFLGKQWLQERASTVSDGYTILEESESTFRPVDNYSAQLTDIKRSQILGKNLRPNVMPNSDGKDDRDSARLGRLLLRAKFDLDEEEDLYNVLFLISQIFGVCWRADVKQPHPYEYINQPMVETTTTEFYQCTTPECTYIGDTPDPCPACGSAQMQQVQESAENPIMGEDGQPQINQIPVMVHECYSIDPFRMKVSPAASRKQITWITETTLQSVSWVRDAYFCPQKKEQGFCLTKAEDVKKSETLPRGLKISEEFKNSIVFNHSTLHRDVTTGDSTSNFTNSEETVILRKSYFNPSKKYAGGRLIIWTDDAVVYDGNPDVPEVKLASGRKKLKAWHGYKYFVYRVNPLRIEGIAFLNDLIPLNKKLNSYDAMIMEHLEKMATPTEVEFANVIKNNDDHSDGIIQIQGNPSLPNGGAPFYLNVPQLSNDVYSLRDAIIMQMEKTARVTEIVQGLRPAGVDTYGGLQLLRDAADAADSELYNRWYKFFRETQQGKLAILQECLISADEDLMDQMDIIRQNEGMGKEEVSVFSGQDLRNNLNISVEETDYVTQTRTAENARVKGAIADKLMLPDQAYDPLTQLQLFRKLGMGDTPLPKKADIEKAERIIQYLEAGNVQQAQGLIQHFDDMPLQIRVWTNWMKSAKFESLNPQIKMGAIQFLQAIENKLLMAQQQKISDMNAKNHPMGSPQGGPPGDQIPPPPPMG